MTDYHQDGRAGIDAALVRRLIADQFPQWADLPVTPVQDRRLGQPDLPARRGADRPAAHARGYVAAVDKEHRWLPLLAPRYRSPIPEAVPRATRARVTRTTGRSGAGSPARPRQPETVADLDDVRAVDAEFILALQSRRRHRRPGRWRAQLLPRCAARVLPRRDSRGPRRLKGRIDTDLAREVWDAALATRRTGRRCGSTATSRPAICWSSDGRLSAVIDFGTSGVGDPACDLVIA